MKSLAKRRKKIGVSQRNMANLASLSFRTIQLLESGNHDAKISTLKNIATALGYPLESIEYYLDFIFQQPLDSIVIISQRILFEEKDSWKIWLFNFVDAFRKYKDPKFVEIPPTPGLSEKLNALLASVVETLCYELNIKTPNWCKAIPGLNKPWFVSGIENLKAISIVESPIYFKKRNIFVLENFLSRS